jgi:hypothetical protein
VLRSGGVRLLPVDWLIIKGSVVGGLVGLFLGNHLADVTGLEVWQFYLWGLVGGLLVGAIGTALCQAYRVEGYGVWILLGLLCAFLQLAAYRFFRRDDWFLVRSYGAILVGANVVLLVLTIGRALLGNQHLRDKMRARRLIIIVGLIWFLAGLAYVLSAAIAAGQVGSQLGGQIGRGIGETLGALLGLPLVVTVLLLYVVHVSWTGVSVRGGREWLGFLVLALANAGVVWLLLG